MWGVRMLLAWTCASAPAQMFGQVHFHVNKLNINHIITSCLAVILILWGRHMFPVCGRFRLGHFNTCCSGRSCHSKAKIASLRRTLAHSVTAAPVSDGNPTVTRKCPTVFYVLLVCVGNFDLFPFHFGDVKTRSRPFCYDELWGKQHPDVTGCWSIRKEM